MHHFTYLAISTYLLHLTSIPVFADENLVSTKTVRVLDIHRNGNVGVLGHLGVPVGTMVKLEGKRARALKTTNAKTLHVENINGKAFKPDKGYSPYIQVANVDTLPEGEVITVEGYEFIEWVGDPARNWHLDAFFVITKAYSPIPSQLEFYELRFRPSQGFLVHKPPKHGQANSRNDEKELAYRDKTLVMEERFQQFLTNNAEGLVGQNVANYPDIETLAMHCLDHNEIAKLNSLPALVRPTVLNVDSKTSEKKVRVTTGNLFEFKPKSGDKLFMFTKEGLVPAGGHSPSPGLGVYVREGVIWALVEFGLDAVP